MQADESEEDGPSGGSGPGSGVNSKSSSNASTPKKVRPTIPRRTSAKTVGSAGGGGHISPLMPDRDSQSHSASGDGDGDASQQASDEYSWESPIGGS
jgi:hypothetical protein